MTYGDSRIYKKVEIIRMIRRYQRFVSYEEREELRRPLKQFLTAGLSQTFMMGIAKSVIKNQRSTSTAFFYLFHAVRLNPMLPLYNPRFW